MGIPLSDQPLYSQNVHFLQNQKDVKREIRPALRLLSEPQSRRHFSNGIPSALLVRQRHGNYPIRRKFAYLNLGFRRNELIPWQIRAVEFYLRVISGHVVVIKNSSDDPQGSVVLIE